jgi:hypothetical protein
VSRATKCDGSSSRRYRLVRSRVVSFVGSIANGKKIPSPVGRARGQLAQAYGRKIGAKLREGTWRLFHQGPGAARGRWERPAECGGVLMLWRPDRLALFSVHSAETAVDRRSVHAEHARGCFDVPARLLEHVDEPPGREAPAMET